MSSSAGQRLKNVFYPGDKTTAGNNIHTYMYIYIYIYIYIERERERERER